jgi:hypothetical protein
MDVPRQLAPVALTPGEAAALIAAIVAIGPYTSAAAHTALQKLLGALAPSRTGRRGSVIDRLAG